MHKVTDKQSSAVQLVVFIGWCVFALGSVLAMSGCQDGLHREIKAGTIVPLSMSSFQSQDPSTLFAQEKASARIEALPAQF